MSKSVCKPVKISLRDIPVQFRRSHRPGWYLATENPYFVDLSRRYSLKSEAANACSLVNLGSKLR